MKGSELAKPTSAGPYRNIEEAKKHQVSSFPDIKKLPLKPDFDFIVVACDGIWDCFTNEQAAKFVRNKREKGPKKAKSSKSISSQSTASGFSGSPRKGKSAKELNAKKLKPKGETSFFF